jgi:carbonic anhydrase/acetyltransferase-like protein (isoleucine patch superfamily)
MSYTSNDSIILKFGRHEIVLSVGENILSIAAATSSKADNGAAVLGGSNVTAVLGKGKKKKRLSVSTITISGRPSDDGEGDDAYTLTVRFPTGNGGGKYKGPRAGVTAVPTIRAAHYQVTPQDPALLTQAEIDRARTPAQQAILAHPVFSSLFRIHPNGGGLVSIHANVGLNTFVGVSAIVLPGARLSNKAVIEREAVVAGIVSGYGVVTDRAFVHSRARIQDNARIGFDAFIDQRTWIGGKVVVGGAMNIVTDTTGHMILGGFGHFVGNFDLVGAGKLVTGDHAYVTARQIRDLVASCTP